MFVGKERVKLFLKNIQFLFRPAFWWMSLEYSADVDNLINSLLDKYEFSDIGGYTASLGKYKIWIDNQPYACIWVYDYKGKSIIARPSRLTVLRALNKLDETIKNPK